jgi:hypothetical protein
MTMKHTNPWGNGDAPITDEDWNEDHIVDADGLNMVGSATSPVAAAAGRIKLWARRLAGRVMAAYVDDRGVAFTLQPHIARNKIAAWLPVGGGSTAVTTTGCAAMVGTITGRNIGTTSLFESVRRAGNVSNTTAGSGASLRGPSMHWFRGDLPGVGGFHAMIRFGSSDAATVAGARSFAGMCATTSVIGNVNPSSLTNVIGVGTDTGETTLSIFHNDGGGTATKIALGANFPDHTLSADLYNLEISCAPNTTSVTVEITRLNTGHKEAHVLSTDIPAATQLLNWQVWRNNSTTAAAVAVDVASVYVESET